MSRRLVCQAIEESRYHQGCFSKLFYSDRGSQYVSEEFENLLLGVTISMSREGNYWGNTVSERFLGTDKS